MRFGCFLLLSGGSDDPPGASASPSASAAASASIGPSASATPPPPALAPPRIFFQRSEALAAEVVASFIKNFDPKRERCWIAEQEGEIVGYVFLVKRSKTAAQLRLLLVEPSARGLGLGTRLVDECIRFSRQVGYRKITLWTNSVLDSARHIEHILQVLPDTTDIVVALGASPSRARGLVIGQAVDQALGDKRGITRFGQATPPKGLIRRESAICT